MKTAVIYFSYEGNCKLIAEQINASIPGDMVALQLEDAKTRKGMDTSGEAVR